MRSDAHEIEMTRAAVKLHGSYVRVQLGDELEGLLKDYEGAVLDGYVLREICSYGGPVVLTLEDPWRMHEVDVEAAAVVAIEASKPIRR